MQKIQFTGNINNIEKYLPKILGKEKELGVPKNVIKSGTYRTLINLIFTSVKN